MNRDPIDVLIRRMERCSLGSARYRKLLRVATRIAQAREIDRLTREAC
jgi:hypothetical protein